MSNVDHPDLKIVDLSNQVGFLKILVGALTSVIVIGFSAGLIWAKLLQTVRKLQGLGIEWRKGAGVKEFRQLSPPWPSEAT